MKKLFTKKRFKSALEKNSFFRFFFFVFKKFIQDDCFYRASALTFASLLTIVPLMYISLSFLSFFPVAQNISILTQNFIFENFVPATGQIIQSYFKHISFQMNHLPLIDMTFLFTTIFFMMLMVEQALNIIWKAPRRRHNLHAVMLCLSILCLLPLLLGLSLTATSYFNSFYFFEISHPSFISKIIPFSFSFIGFTFVYLTLPNCPVKLSTGLFGGVISAILFECTKHGFVWYLSQFHGYEKIYGAFAVFPMFLMWVYIVWVITLLGAEIAYAWENFSWVKTQPTHRNDKK